MANEPASAAAWIQFQDIIGVIKRLNVGIQQIRREIDRLKSIKEDILDNTELRAELKKVVDTYHDATLTLNFMESLYTRFQALRNYMDENEC